MLGRYYFPTLQIRKFREGNLSILQCEVRNAKGNCLLGSLSVHLFPTAQMFENESSCFPVPLSCPVLALEQIRACSAAIRSGK